MPSNRKRRIRQLMAESNASYQQIVNALEYRGGQPNPVPWLIEKATIALVECVRLVDLANEPDTNAWYRGALKTAATRMIGRLAPVVAVLCDRPEAADRPSKWEPMVDGGTPALRAWASEHELLADLEDWIGTTPPQLSTPHAVERDRAERIEKPPIPADAANRAAIQLRLLQGCTSWLMRRELPRATQRLMLWLMLRLEAGDYVDVVTISRNFLADDLGVTCAEAEAAYRELCEAGVLERVDYLPAPENPDCFLVRVALLGDNESKYPRPYEPVTFGPGVKDGRRRAWEG